AAVRRGYIPEADAATLSEEDLASLIFLPGFSTAAQLSEVSGRGVGMDVVRSTVHKLKGTLSTESVPGRGVTVTIRLPLTLAVARVLVVQAHGERFALPLSAVRQILRLEEAELERLGEEQVVRVGGQAYPVVRLAQALHLAQPGGQAGGRAILLIVQ